MIFRYFIALVIMLFCTPLRAGEAAELTFTELLGAKLETTQTITPEMWKGKPALLVFWRSDCAPCLQEMQHFPDMAAQNKDLPIMLISLHDVAHTRRHAPITASNVHVLVAENDGKAILSAFGNTRTLALPYSVMLDATGKVCGKYYGILSPDKIKEWRKSCS